MPRGGIPGKINLLPVTISIDQHFHHAYHLSGILFGAKKVMDLVLRQFQCRRKDQAASRFLPLWYDALLVRSGKRKAQFCLNGKWAKFVDGEECFVQTEAREDRPNPIEFLREGRVVRSQHHTSFTPPVPC